ncbi:uncharacterized protein LOC114742851 isoform X2 [Neltuma alba]|uniref:uncharacterized protein LOC114742851 isoform X2 n=1 Tax=Neltuma alba TaxID=207710 RepID=UPI0010A378AB|nr:uncharacterized protein LOC114742851 isoform X2 [Prosopis alba]
MLKLRDRQGPAGFLYWQALNRHHHRQLMAYLMRYEPSSFFNKAFSKIPGLSSDYSSSPFLQKLVYSKVCRVNRSIYTVKGCFDSNVYSNSVFLKTKARGYTSLPHSPLLADLEDISSRSDGLDAAVIDVDNRSSSASPAKPLSFQDHRLSQKFVVAVDVDEVLGNFLSALNRFIADRYSSNYSVSEYHVYEFFKIWNCSRDEADVRVHEFFKTQYFMSGIQPIPGARKALEELSTSCSLSVVTSRQNAIKDHTIEWIEEYYPGLFQEIHFGNHFALDGLSRPKSEICRSLGAKVLIDDNPRYAVECAEAGIRVLLFDYQNSYPWCNTDVADGHPLITRVTNWQQVQQQFVSLLAS